jgi:hypothetical protein
VAAVVRRVLVMILAVAVAFLAAAALTGDLFGANNNVGYPDNYADAS